MNTDVMFSSKKMDWATPQKFFDDLNSEFHFTLDPCADLSNHKCKNYFTQEHECTIMHNIKGELRTAALASAKPLFSHMGIPKSNRTVSNLPTN